MSDVAIHIEQLSKAYRITHTQSKQTVVRYKTLQEDLLALPRRLWSAVRNGQPAGSNRETVWALKDVSLDIHEGEVVGIIGRNGAGKSTLLKILSRITDPTEGRAEVYGRVGSLLEVGTGFHPELTGRENIFLSGAILGMTRQEVRRKLDEIVAFAEVEKFLDTPAKHYSSGMYVRLAFAVAAHLETENLLVDEVLAVGDTEFQSKCLGKMQDVAGEGRTVMFVSHNMGAVQRLCSRAMVLNSGQIGMIGSVNKAIEHYLSIAMHQQGERIWETAPQPGNDIVRLVAMRFRDQRGEIAAEFDVREPVQIEVEYRVLRQGCQICVVLELLGLGAPIAVAFDDYIQRPWRQQPPRRPGTFRATYRVPGDFFTEGQVSINLRIFSPPDQPNVNPHVRLFDVMQLMIIDRMDPGGVRGYFPYNWGMPTVRPRLECTTEQVSGAISNTD